MPKRTKSRQTKHNAKIGSLARRYKRDGWTVKADLAGHDRPEPIGKEKRIPDLVVQKRGAKRIIEVETPETLTKEKDQQATFSRSAGQQERTTFIIEETN